MATVESHVLCIQIQAVPHRERTLSFIESYQLMLSRGIISSLLSKLYKTKTSKYTLWTARNPELHTVASENEVDSPPFDVVTVDSNCSDQHITK
jgi:hypothetical protein